MKQKLMSLYARKPIFYNILVTYMVLIFVFAIIGSTINSISTSALKRSIKNTGANYLSYTKNMFESNIQGIEALVYDISENRLISKVMSAKEETAELEGMYETIIDSISYYKNNLMLAEEVFVMFHNIDLCLLQDGKSSRKIAYEAYFKSYYDSFDSFNRDLTAHNVQQYKVLKDGAGYKKVVFMQSIPIKGASKATLIVTLSESKLRPFRVTDSQNPQSGTVFVLNREGEVIFGNPPSVDLERVIKAEDFARIKDMDGGDWVISREETRDGRSYVYALPYEAFQSNTLVLRNTVAVVNIAFIIAGLILAYWTARKNYTPINKILDAFRINYDMNIVPRYHSIDAALSQIFDERKGFISKLDKQQKMLKSVYIQSLLTGSKDTSSLPKEYNPDFFDGMLTVAVFYIGDFGILGKNGKEGESRSLSHFALANVFKEKCEESGFECFFQEIESFLACIIKLKDREGYGVIDEKLSFTQSFMAENFSLTYNCAVSLIGESAEALPELYRQASSVISYCFFDSGSTVLHYNEGTESMGCSDKTDSEQKSKLYNLILACDHENASAVVHELLSSFHSTNSDPGTAKLFLFDIFNVAINAIKNSRADRELIREKCAVLSNALFEPKTINDMESILNRTIAEVCTAVNETKSSKSEQVKEAIASAIDRHLADSRLDATMIAGEAGISAGHLSNIFKAHFGVSFTAYVMNRRINMAKELLCTSSMTVNEISHATGFTNSNMFIRAFKKSEGITPGQYREKISSL